MLFDKKLKQQWLKKLNLSKENLTKFLKDDDNIILINLVNYNSQTLLQWFNISAVFKITS